MFAGEFVGAGPQAAKVVDARLVLEREAERAMEREREAAAERALEREQAAEISARTCAAKRRYDC